MTYMGEVLVLMFILNLDVELGTLKDSKTLCVEHFILKFRVQILFGLRIYRMLAFFEIFYVR